MAARKKGRDIDGVVLLDKPVGVSSNHALQAVRKLFQAKKAGHTGSLDPLASGLLPICLGEATKISACLLDANKTYRVTAHLGYETTTGDREGQATRVNEQPLPGLEQVAQTLAQFVGDVEQIPPMYSALKSKGQPLYKLARQGKTIKRKARTVHVYELKVIAYQDDQLTLEAHVSRGTYIRTLVEDIARSWGGAAHVAKLRRTALGPYSGETMLTIEQLEFLASSGLASLDAQCVAASQALPDWPRVDLDAKGQQAVGYGQRVGLLGHWQAGTQVKIFDDREQFLGLGVIENRNILKPNRMFVRALR